LVILELTPEGDPDLRVVNLAGDDETGWTAGETTDFLATQFVEVQASFSPDGRWLAYTSSESEAVQVWVRGFPQGGSTRISIEGRAHLPVWSSADNELMFGNRAQGARQGEVFVASYTIEGDDLIAERPVRWEGGTYDHQSDMRGFDLDPNGERLLVRRRAKSDAETEQTLDRFALFENFFGYLREKIPVDGK
jgi:Tol biopolymer transport system component